MRALEQVLTLLSVFGLLVVLQPLQGLAQQQPAASRTSARPAPAQRDGQHDFDFEIGTWRTRLSRLQHPLSGSTTWVEYEGTTVVRKVWNGRANLVELVADGPAGHFEGLSLRLYNPADAAVEPQLCRRQERRPQPARDRRLQERARRVLRPGDVQWPGHLRPLRHLGHHSRLLPFRTGVLGRRRQDMGGELDRHRHAGERAGRSVLPVRPSDTIDGPAPARGARPARAAASRRGRARQATAARRTGGLRQRSGSSLGPAPPARSRASCSRSHASTARSRSSRRRRSCS